MKTEKIRESILGGKTSLGIELGSTRIKGILVDENNEVIAAGGYSWENKLENGIWTYHLNDDMSRYIISTMFGRVCANATERLPMM